MKKYLNKFFYILGHQKAKLIPLFMVILLTSFLEAVGVGLIGPFIALASNPSLIQSSAFLSWIYEASSFDSVDQFIVVIAISILIVFYVKAFFNFKVREYVVLFSLFHQRELRLRLLNSYLRLPYSFHLKSNTAFLIQNIVNDADVFCNKTLLQVLNSTVNIVMMATLIGLLLITDALSTLAASLIIFLGIALVIRFRKRLSLWGKISSQSKAEMIRIINHSLGGLKETRLVGCESYFEQQLSHQSKRYAEACGSSMSFAILPRLLIEALVMTFILGLASISLLTNRDSDSLIATLGVFGVVAIRLMPVATQVTSGITQLRSSSYVVDKLYFDLKELENFEESSHQHFNVRRPKTETDKLTTLPLKEKICLSRISFQYEGAKELALRGVDLVLHKGESIALIGKSGAGKTTLVDLILGLLMPHSGDILVDGKSIYRNLRAWQNLIGYIPQSIFLIDDTLERNIAYGVPDERIDAERLRQSIEASQLKDLVEEMPEGVKTCIGEQGMCLSGGQRQRVGIARALYHEREILVLDEATSALDNETEHLVTEAIRALSGKKTMIIIAHRLSTVEHCDRIYMMEKGQVVKSGTYQEVVLSHSYTPSM
ncbi:MAG: ABC transporter ATP-binding protein [Cyanobacteria bacterium P01_C01_bin.120]